MNDKQLVEKRVLPALREMYGQADNIFQDKHSNWPSFPAISYDEIETTIKKTKENYPKFDPHFILECFYLDEPTQKEILKKYTKNLKHTWRWPYKSQIIYSVKDIKEMKKKLKTLEKDSIEYEDLKYKIDHNDIHIKHEKLWKEYYTQLLQIWKSKEDKKITAKEARSAEAKLAKQYNCQWRSRDAEAVYFGIWNYSPCCSKDVFEKYQILWRKICCTKTIKTSENMDRIADEVLKNENMEEWQYNIAKNRLVNANLFATCYFNLFGENTNK